MFPSRSRSMIGPHPAADDHSKAANLAAQSFKERPLRFKGAAELLARLPQVQDLERQLLPHNVRDAEGSTVGLDEAEGGFSGR